MSRTRNFFRITWKFLRWILNLLGICLFVAFRLTEMVSRHLARFFERITN